MKRNIVVAMPFGKPGVERRKAILHFQRLKYVIEQKCRVVPGGPRAAGDPVTYEVNVARTFGKHIPEHALKQIRDADILVVLLSGRNPTVTYELGYRRACESEDRVILVVDSKDDLPVYESPVGFQDWGQDDVLAQIDSIAGNSFPALDDFDGDIPGSLKDVVDARDHGLVNQLQFALREKEQDYHEPPSDPVVKIRGMLSESIVRFYPFSVVEVDFERRGEFAEDSPPRVVDFDDQFSQLYGYPGAAAARWDGPLTLGRLSNRLEKFSDTADWAEFMEEQQRLTDTVIRKHGFAIATVPLKFNDSHPYAGFRNKWYLPCMAAVARNGDTSGPHEMYLLVAYIETTRNEARLLTGVQA